MKMREGEMTMKKRRLVALATAAVMALSLAACGGGSSSTTDTTAAGSAEETTGSSVTPDAHEAGQQLAHTVRIGDQDAEPVDGGTLVVSMPSAPRTMDPVDYTTVYEAAVMYNVLDTLFIWNEEYNDVLPNLVTDYSVSDDGLSYTMTLRDDVYFQDGQYVKGRKMTAEDVKYSLERSKEESPTDRVCRDFFDYVEVLSDTEFVIHMTSPAGPFLNQLAEIGTAIVPREEVEGWGDDFGSHIVGSGPFTLEEVVTDERV